MVVHGVAHVQGAGDVGQRHHDDVAAVARPVVGHGVEGAGGAPQVVDGFFDLRRFICFGEGELAAHGRFLKRIKRITLLQPPGKSKARGSWFGARGSGLAVRGSFP